jgi:hypothetical protein
MDDALTKAREKGRHLVGADGEPWLVYEVGPSYDRRGRSLVFESEKLVRRVRIYPAQWRALPDAELALLKDAL